MKLADPLDPPDYSDLTERVFRDDPMTVCPIHGLPLWQCRSNGCNCPSVEKAS